MEYLVLGVVIGIVVLVMAVVSRSRRRVDDEERSWQAHEAARRRDPPVEIGGTYDLGVLEFTGHHSGESVAVGKVEGFVLFVENVPSDVDEGDVIRAKVLSFNKGRTSADATFVSS